MNMVVRTAVASSVPSSAFAAVADDRALLDLEREIFDAHEKATANNAEIERLHTIWRDEWLRLDAESARGGLSREQISEIIGKMPEAIEQKRLNDFAQPHFDRMDELIEQMWATPALTQEGRRAKLQVLLTCIGGWRWTDADKDADYDIKKTRDLLLEMLGGEQAECFKQQFAA